MIISRADLKKHTGVDFYDGIMLHSRWAFQIIGPEKILPIGNIVAFRAPMSVSTKYMVDVEDRIAKDFIESEDAINFVWEIPDISPLAGVLFQRLFATSVGNLVAKYLNDGARLPGEAANIEIAGDDIIVHDEFVQRSVTQLKGKASVSISCWRNNAVLGHLGINVNAGDKAPSFAYSTRFSDEQVEKFAIECNNAFYSIMKSCWIATTKTI